MSEFNTFTFENDPETGFTSYLLRCAGCGIGLRYMEPWLSDEGRREKVHHHLMAELMKANNHNIGCLIRNEA